MWAYLRMRLKRLPRLFSKSVRFRVERVEREKWVSVF
jgi:hypothetical protein